MELKHLLFIAVAATSIMLTSCSKDDDNNDDSIPEGNEVSVKNNISQNTTWESGKVYILENRVAVLNGVTLTIEPGVIVKGQAGTGANATCLIVARGAKIMAEGTESQPIIFTSVADEIEPGQIASPNLDNTLNGLW